MECISRYIADSISLNCEALCAGQLDGRTIGISVFNLACQIVNIVVFNRNNGIVAKLNVHAAHVTADIVADKFCL